MLKASRFGLGLVAAALVACGTESQSPAPQENTPSFQASEEELMGAFVNKAKSLDAVGTIGFKNDDGSYSFMCTATLIAPKVVLTAKHCAVELGQAFFGMSLTDLTQIYFAVGPDAKNPVELVEVIDTAVTAVSGGSLGIGLDVAILHLAAAPKDVAPLTYAKTALDPNGKGTKLATVGYGTQDVYAFVAAQYGIDALDGLRRAGQSTQQEQSGNAYAALGFTKEEYVQDFVDAYGEEFLAAVLGAEWRAILESWYDEAQLMPGQEGAFGGAAKDASTAPGDSGGPTFRRAVAADGKSFLEVVAVTSWGLSNNNPTDANVFATLQSEEAQTLISNAFSYVDPCEGLTRKGACDGTVATRCRGDFEGPRRALAIDCSTLLLDCGTDAEGYAACVDPSTGEVTGSPDAKPANAPTKVQIRENIAKLSSGQLTQKARELQAKQK